MKRLILLMVLLATLTTAGAAAQSSGTLTLGIVLYRFDAFVWPIGQYAAPLEADLDLLPLPEYQQEERLPAGPGAWAVPVELVMVEASSPAEQAASIAQLLAQGVDGLVVAPAGADPILVEAVQQTVAFGIPVVLVHRDLSNITSPRKAYVGVEYHTAGYAIGHGALGVTATGSQKYPLDPEDRFAVYVRDPGDPLQRKLAEGFAMAVGDHLLGTYSVSETESYAHTVALIEAAPALNSIFLTHPALLPGTLEKIRETATPGKHIRVVTFGAPPEYEALIKGDLFNGTVSHDLYSDLLKALVQLKSHILYGAALHDEYTQIELRLRFHLAYGTFTRYPYESPFGFDLLFMWWLN